MCSAADCTRGGARNGKVPFCRYHVHRLRDFKVTLGQTTWACRVVDLIAGLKAGTLRSQLETEANKYLANLPPEPVDDDDDPDAWLVDGD